MRLNWTGYQYRAHDGYGRYGAYMIRALLRAGVDVSPLFEEELIMPAWLQEMRGVRFDDRLTISCIPPYFVQKAQGRHWLLTMTEGSECPEGWAEQINRAGIERLIVPCEHNADVFRCGGVACAVSVIPGGTDPDEFPLIRERRPNRPYTFLTLADRGFRKGWNEVYQAFFKAFGAVNEVGPDKVRLIIKWRPGGNEQLDVIRQKGIELDRRITYLCDDTADIRDLFAQVDCVALPSRTEGFGMPHRENAMMGLPVIVQAHSGLDDGHTHEWAIVLEKGHMRPIEDQGKHIAGEWMVADVDELAGVMRWCYENRSLAKEFGGKAAKWLSLNQTWSHSAEKLIALMRQEDVVENENALAEIASFNRQWIDRQAKEVVAWPI